MRQIIISIVYSVITIVLFQTCSSVPLTGRSQLNMIPSSEMLSMSYQQYDVFLKENKLSTNMAEVNMVKRVGGNIQQAVDRYMADNNLSVKVKWLQMGFQSC